MLKRNAVLPIRPESGHLFVGAARGKPCKTSERKELRNAVGTHIAVLHVARIKKAAKIDSSLRS